MHFKLQPNSSSARLSRPGLSDPPTGTRNIPEVKVMRWHVVLKLSATLFYLMASGADVAGGQWWRSPPWPSMHIYRILSHPELCFFKRQNIFSKAARHQGNIYPVRTHKHTYHFHKYTVRREWVFRVELQDDNLPSTLTAWIDLKPPMKILDC